MKTDIIDFVKQAISDTGGVLHLTPTWVPRSFLVPGRRMKLHPDDLYPFGIERGGIDERWIGSTTQANNGPGTPPDEGLSYIIHEDVKYTLKDAIASSGDEILGSEIMKKYGGWKVYSKFFDNMDPIPHHLHQMDSHAKEVGMEGKPEAYYFPMQMNFIENTFPYTFFGLKADTRKDDVINCLKNWDKGDNKILNYSKASKLIPGTGWLLPAGILHAPGTLVTYEVQWASDVLSLFQSVVNGKKMNKDLLTINVPDSKKNDYDYLMSMIDWDINLDSDFDKKFFLKPVDIDNKADEEFKEKWVVYGRIEGREYFSAKELTVQPKAKVTIKDKGAYSAVAVQGYGKINDLSIANPTLIRYGEVTNDEFFITKEGAQTGIHLENHSNEPLVILKCFGPDTNPDMPGN